MVKEMLAGVRTVRPLIHCITNYVTANDCANILLACGASPVMADDETEVEDVTSICRGLSINIGTLNSRSVPAILKAGRRANALGHPVVFDPVGAGASAHRTETALRLLKEVRFAVIRGNSSEIRTLIAGSGTTRGVDADLADQITEEKLEETAAVVRRFARQTGAVVAVTGAIDLVADAETAYCIDNGHPMMRSITGAGCMLSAMTAAYVAANPVHRLEAAAAAVCAMGLCGEKAFGRLGEAGGNASFRNYLIDAVYRLTPEELEQGARYRICRP